MKLFLVLLFFVVNYAAVACAETEYNIIDIYCDSSKYCTDKKGQPVNGVVKSFSKIGKLNNEVFYKDGKQDGRIKFYDIKGNLASERVGNGHAREYYASGALRTESVVDEKSNGYIKTYYETGALREDIKLVNGKWKRVKQYYAGGALKSKSNFNDNGEIDGVREHYYESGALSSKMWYENDKFIRSETYYESGELQEESLGENGELVSQKDYYKSGQLQRELNYKNNELNGIAKEYYENGALKKEVVFKDGVVSEPCKNYDETGDMHERNCFGIY